VLNVVDSSTGQLHAETTGLSVAVSLLDGYGRNLSDKLGPADKLKKIPVSRGVVTVAGLRFHAVSSKNGGEGFFFFFDLYFETFFAR
jgi:hypothetical protein